MFQKSVQIIIIIFVMFSVLFSYSAIAQESEISPVQKKELKTLIHKISDSLEKYYVNLEKGKKTGDYIKGRYTQGSYKELSDPKELAKVLTADLRSVHGDKHLYVSFRPLYNSSEPEKKIKRLDKSGIWSNYGFQEVQVLDGNIGYVRIANFSNWDNLDEAKEAATATMNMVSNTDAIIFDVRNNSGGVPYLVSHVASYLFEGERVHLTQYVERYNNSSYGIYTETNIPGRKLPNVPVYILVNNKTASAGEEFAFWLKNLERATIIGETTMGAGYGAMSHRLNDRFIVSISSEVEINPITKTNFEQVGVIPNIKTVNDSAYSKALGLAKIASRDFRENINANNEVLLESLNSALETEAASVDSILSALKSCKEAQILNERKINRMGYDHLTKLKKAKTAEYILESNTILYPESANVYDSFAEVLAVNGKHTEALANYKKAVEIAKITNDSNLELFIKNVEKTENAIKNKN